MGQLLRAFVWDLSLLLLLLLPLSWSFRARTRNWQLPWQESLKLGTTAGAVGAVVAASVPLDLLSLPLRMELHGLAAGEAQVCPGVRLREAVACCVDLCEGLPTCDFWNLRLADRLCSPGRNYTGSWRPSPRGLGPDAVRSGLRAATARGRSVEVLRWGLRPLEEDLWQLREELHRPCPEPDYRPAAASAGWRNLSRVDAWLSWAQQQPDGQVQRFPEHEVLLSTKTCLNELLRAQQPWYRMRQRQGQTTSGAYPPRDLRQDWELGDLTSNRNLAAFESLGRPSCALGEGPFTYAHRADPPPLEEFAGERGSGTQTEMHGIAVAVSDLSTNICHAVGQMLFLQSALELCRAKFSNREGDCKLVPVQGSLNMTHFPFPLHQLVAKMLGIDTALQNNVFLPQEGSPPRKCYHLLLQRSAWWPSRSERYTRFRQGAQDACALGKPDGMDRKMLFWFKKRLGNRKFHALHWVRQTLQSFAQERHLKFTSTELFGPDLLKPACQQVLLFLNLALFVGVHGAAGVNVLWMPQDSVYVEVRFSTNVKTRTSQSGLFRDVSTRGGRLFVQYTNVLEAGLSTGMFPEFIILDARDLVSVLQVLYTNWLELKLPTSSSAGV